MLDLLIHVTAANKISPSGHVLQVTDGDGRLLSHKPSTPIGITIFFFTLLSILFKNKYFSTSINSGGEYFLQFVEIKCVSVLELCLRVGLALFILLLSAWIDIPAGRVFLMLPTH